MNKKKTIEILERRLERLIRRIAEGKYKQGETYDRAERSALEEALASLRDDGENGEGNRTGNPACAQSKKGHTSNKT